MLKLIKYEFRRSRTSLIVMLAAALDRLTGDSNICRSAAIGFYAANEGLSIM